MLPHTEMPLWGIDQNSELIRQTSTKVHLLSRPYSGAPGCASHFQKATPLPVALHGSFIHLGLCQNILISQCYIFNMILLGGIANTPGAGLLAADQRGYRSVFQAGFWRRAWLWRRMGKCPGGRQAVLGGRGGEVPAEEHREGCSPSLQSDLGPQP